MANPSAVAFSPSGRHGPLIGFFERVPIIAGSAVAMLGAVAMGGWALNAPLFTTAASGGYPILPLTALFFGLALLSIPHDQRKNDLRAQMFATPGLLIALLAILGYLFGVKGMYSLSQSSGMALPTAIGELLLGIGILLTVRDRGVGVLLLDEGAAGVLTRRLLPAALLAPIVLGVVRLVGESAGIYESEFGESLFAIASILTFVGLVLWSARVLRNTDKERVDLLALEQQARAHAEKARAEAETA